MKKLIFIMCSFLLLSGCITIPKVNQPTMMALDPSQLIKVKIIIPKNENIAQVDSSGIIELQYGDLIQENYDKYGIYYSGYEIITYPGKLYVSKLKGYKSISNSYPPKIGKITYNVDQYIEDNGDFYTVTLSPVSKGKKIPFDLIQSTYVPEDFSISELGDIISGAWFKVKFEIDSPFSVDSTHSNFVRLLKKVPNFEAPIKEAHGHITAQYFFLDIDGLTYKPAIETFPYREKSKVVVTVWIKGNKDQNNVVDIRHQINLIKEKISEIIQS